MYSLYFIVINIIIFMYTRQCKGEISYMYHTQIRDDFENRKVINTVV